MFKKIIVILFIVSFNFSFAKESENFGLANGIWFSEKEFFKGDKIFVNSIFYNESNTKIKVKVVFLDNKKSFFEKEFEVEKKDLFYIKAPYIAKEGSRDFEVKVVEILDLNKEEQESVLNSIEQKKFEKKVVVDKDTDKDGVGDKKDNDDDGDGVLDIIEKERGTDPLDKNSKPEEFKTPIDKTKDIAVKTVEITKDVSEKVNKDSKPILENIRKKLESKISVIEKEIEEVEKNNTEKKSLKNKIETTPHEKNDNKVLKNKAEKENTVFSDEKVEISGFVDVDKKKEKEKEVSKIKIFYLYFLKFLILAFSNIVTAFVFSIFILYLILKIVKFIFRKKDEY